MTAIHLAAKNGHNLVIEILKEKIPLDYASPKVRSHSLKPLLDEQHCQEEIACSYGAWCSKFGAYFQTGLSAIHVAAQYGRTEVVREILRQADFGDLRSEGSKSKKDEEVS